MRVLFVLVVVSIISEIFVKLRRKKLLMRVKLAEHAWRKIR